MPRLFQKTLTMALHADEIAQNLFGGCETTCFYFFDARFDSVMK